MPSIRITLEITKKSTKKTFIIGVRMYWKNNENVK